MWVPFLTLLVNLTLSKKRSHDWQPLRTCQLPRGDSPSLPGCVVLDVEMPQMTGLELQQAMLERGIRLPIFFLTAHGDVEMTVNAVLKGP